MGCFLRSQFYPKRRFSKVVDRFTIELGSCPVKSVFPLICNALRLLQFDNEVMNSHPSLLFASSLLLCNLKVRRACSLPSVGGTCPLNLFLERSSTRRLVRLEIEAGMNPVNWLTPKVRIGKLGNLLPMSAGMRPRNMFP